MMEFPPFRLDLVNQCLWRRADGANEQRILLTPKAFAMLRYLLERSGRLVTQDELLEALWPETYVQPEVLKSHIRDIRSALGDDPKNARFIETLPRRGYRFIAPLTDDSEKTTSWIGYEAHSEGHSGASGNWYSSRASRGSGRRLCWTNFSATPLPIPRASV